VDLFRIDVTQDAIAIRFDPALATASSMFFIMGDLRRISIGPAAFRGARTLAGLIRKELAQPSPTSFLGPGFGSGAPTPLSQDDAEGAAGANSGILDDPRAVRATQSFVSARPTGTFDAATAQAIADVQKSSLLSRQDGIIDDDFFNLLVQNSSMNGDFEVVIRLIVDYGHIAEGDVIDARVDPAVTTDFTLSSAVPGAPVTILFGSAALSSQATPDIVAAVTRGYDAARARLAGPTP
jgi:hypothetical protein